MTQRIFDVENAEDMQDLWDILPEYITSIYQKKESVTCLSNWVLGNDEVSFPLSFVSILWHDKTEITRPIQEATEQDVGKLCYFWGDDDKNDFAYGILGSIGTENGEKYYNIDNIDEGLYFEHARRLTKQEIEELC